MMHIFRFFLLLALAPWSAMAAQTQIAQVPLLNITGTGTVKPNLMLLFDNSGSMDQTYTPDYVDDNICRSSLTLAFGTMACAVGHPPFMSPDFNKQYYNPQIRYAVPLRADGSAYPVQNAATTSNWTSVSPDGYGVSRADLAGNPVNGNINLVTGFPDLRWCVVVNNVLTCQTNTSSYTYPDLVYQTPYATTSGPYYYTIGVGQYCADDTLRSCVSTAIGANAPPGYPVPVKVRWCSDRQLTQCQGKRVGNFIYPAYSQPTGALAAYGTISIGASSTATALGIRAVTLTDAQGNSSALIGNTVSAPAGTNTAFKQQTMASALAAAIIATPNASGRQMYACVKTPTGQSTVPPCSQFGITIGADNVVAVVPLLCVGTTKSLSSCVPVNDLSRQGWGLTVDTTQVQVSAATPARSVITFAGNNTSTVLNAVVRNLAFGSTTLIGNSAFSSPAYLDLGRNRNAAYVANAIATRIGTGGSIRAYIGGNALCPNLSTANVCLLDYNATSNNAAISNFTIDNQGGLSWVRGATSGYAAPVNDSIPVTTASISGGLGAPNPFVRVNIVSGRTYPKATDRSDCAGTSCTYAEEMTNFANWYVYYKTRLQMMKTSLGIAFSPITSNYKVGYVKLSTAGVGGAIDMKPADFTGSARENWYAMLYNTTSSGSTPIRTAMDNVGRMFANLSPYAYASGAEVVQYPCQQNFMILTTDGYWNGSSTANVRNNDNVENPARFCTQARGCVDPRAQTQPSISDVALHWYNGGSSTGTTSLRPDLEDMTRAGSVPAGAGENTHLHMNTYTLGLGVDGVMTYEPNYDKSPRPGGDFYNLITAAASGCPWNNNGPYVWPDPQTSLSANTVQERVDDLWHAAINGHGKYFSAQEPRDVVSGLSEALSNMQIRTGAAAAAATSTPNVTQSDNDIFSSTFTTVKWYGELLDQKIDITDGTANSAPIWSSHGTLGAQVAAATDARTIVMLNPAGTAGSDTVPFTYANMSGAVAGWFSNKCSALAQCTQLSAADKAIVNDGTNMVNWLRGQQQYADDIRLRAYAVTVNTPAGATGPLPIVLGDIASSKPAYVRAPLAAYPDSSYDSFKDARTDPGNPLYRRGAVFVAANDGMLHAFDGPSGNELWAYVPRITMKKLPGLASSTYGTNHQYTTDGSPEVADVKVTIGAGKQWRTILVAGLNAGGRGYYALDITDTHAPPKQLWEFCADASVCARSDADIGLTFGNPQFGTLANGRWVVFLTSGYNNVPGIDGVAGGDGKGYLYVLDAYTGELLNKIGTGAGDTTTPSGLARITAISADPSADPRATYVYGGDLLGQMWRFDFTAASGAVAVLKMGDGGALKPITTRPDVTLCGVPTASTSNGVTSTVLQGVRMVLWGTGRLLDIPDTANTDLQSLYVVKDSGAAVDVRGPTMVKQSLSLSGTGTNTNVYAITDNAVDLAQRDGWYLDFSLNAGERINLDPQIVSGVANLVTNMPTSSSSCSVGGSSNLYQLNVCNGHAVRSYPAGSTLSNASAAVGYVVVRLPDGQQKIITTLADGTKKTDRGVEEVSAEAHRVGWRRVRGE
ncbi:hypothetical protein ASF61_07680 [Duganella sp. Leaf126]|nr:hypothetical protein ASF61_07680 [Duganella sp. Leaf126]